MIKKTVKKTIITHPKHLSLILFLVVLAIVAIFYRGRDAISGILWGIGVREYSCERYDEKLGSFCNVEKPDFTSFPIKLGAYDPDSLLRSNKSISIDHYFLLWNNYSAEGLNTLLVESKNRNRLPMITIEPYDNSDIGTRKNLLSDVASGKYDESIKKICTVLGEYDQPVWVRWGQEMENVTGRYPWAQAESTNYVKAYQRFVANCSNHAPNAYYVWSPVGIKNLDNYYPGDNFVDYVGLSVFSYGDLDMKDYHRTRLFSEIFNEKYQLVKKFQKPIIISELGVTGSDQHKKNWLYAFFENMPDYPLLKAVIIFNAIDSPGAWGEDVRTPDWKISTDTLS